MKCEKCNYESENNPLKFDVPLCTICNLFAPNSEESFKQYISEKINGEILETFRQNISEVARRGEQQKMGMIKKAQKGNPMSRPAFGYKFENNKLIPAQNFREVEEIFEEFLNTNTSLTKLAKKHNLSINGLKKILKNFTYVGKIKFDGQIHEGCHKPIISSTLFNHVQNKLDKLRIKKN